MADNLPKKKGGSYGYAFKYAKTNPGDNSKLASINAELFRLGKVDLNDEQAVAERIEKYFKIYAKYDMRPTVAGLGFALGHNRQWLHSVVNDKPLGSDGYKAKLPPPVTDLIKKAYEFMEILWESYMVTYKMNPVAGIFLAKNNFGYRDQTEHVLTPNTTTEDIVDAEEIKKRYLSDSDESEE